jgi:hypothetical protein
MCGTRLEGLAGPYAEAAHIRPLGAPHHGPDTPENILCLCPNHHVLLDHGGVGIGEDLSLVGEEGGSKSIREIESAESISIIEESTTEPKLKVKVHGAVPDQRFVTKRLPSCYPSVTVRAHNGYQQDRCSPPFPFYPRASPRRSTV